MRQVVERNTVETVKAIHRHSGITESGDRHRVRRGDTYTLSTKTFLSQPSYLKQLHRINAHFIQL